MSECLREDIIKMEAAANEAEKNGDDSGAKFKISVTSPSPCCHEKFA